MSFSTSMTRLITVLTLGGAAALSVQFSVQAQETTTPATPRADQREAKQQARIAQGAASGTLTAREAQRLEREQGRINQAEANAKADGTVTKHERRRLHRMQDAASKDIHHAKHNARGASAPGN